MIISYYIITIIFIVLFFSFSYMIIPQKNFSEHENRALQSLPDLNIDALIDGTYSRKLHNYFSDQINLRTLMIELKAKCELLMGKSENSGVLLAKDGYLIETHSYTDENYNFLSKNLYKIEKMMQNLTEDHIETYSLIIPRKIDILQEYLPIYYSDERNTKAWRIVGNNHLNLKNTLKTQQNEHHQIFYKTDHHWTAEGAYYAYVEIGDVLGFVPYPLDHFKLTTLSNCFYGTTYSKSGFFFLPCDQIKAPQIENGKYTVTIADTETVLDSLYDFSYINRKDKYSVFLSGNNAHVQIYDTKNSHKETLLLIKDSFSHSLSPYLCEHYNLELIDPRYYNGSIEDYIKKNGINKVLFLFGMDTLASANINIR